MKTTKTNKLAARTLRTRIASYEAEKDQELNPVARNEIDRNLDRAYRELRAAEGRTV